jgi:hypothetical protein
VVFWRSYDRIDLIRLFPSSDQGLKWKRETINIRFPPAHYSMLPTSGYPSAGCSPAEPASVSPETLNLQPNLFFRQMPHISMVFFPLLIASTPMGLDEHLVHIFHPNYKDF